MPNKAPGDEMSKHRYANAKRAADYTIDQRWESYSAEEHDRWDRLFKRQSELLPGRTCDTFLKSLDGLRLSDGGIPDMDRLSDRLEKRTEWRIVPVADLVPDEVFFEHLANKRFPAAAFIRSEDQLDYLQEPDVFHDIFGHAPLLSDPVFSDFMQAYGRGGLRAMKRGNLHFLARLYWYTVEFGIIRTKEGERIYGAGILSSPTECQFALDDASPHRVGFDLERIMRTRYIIDDFQRTYFIIESFEDLLAACYQDFDSLYDKLEGMGDVVPEAIIPGDMVWSRGTQDYFASKAVGFV